MNRLWMIAYDIANDRRRRRVDRVLKNHAERVQESVFEGFISHADLRRLKRELAAEIDTVADSVRFYPLCLWCEASVHSQGRGRRAEDNDYYIF